METAEPVKYVSSYWNHILIAQVSVNPHVCESSNEWVSSEDYIVQKKKRRCLIIAFMSGVSV